jgi:DNA excision repair protein ERCC-4
MKMTCRSRAEACNKMKILVDSREQVPFNFKRFGVEVIQATLPVGDYSLVGFEEKVGIERKGLDDLVACLMGDNRDRFQRELQKGKYMDCFVVVVEGLFSDLANGRYRSQMNPAAALQSVLTFQVRYRTHFLFAGTRDWAEYATCSLLTKYLHEIEARFNQATRAGHELKLPRTRAA